MHEIDSYLERTGLRALPSATESGLRELHAAQAFAIPFENLSVLLGEPVSVEPGAIFAKLVRSKRGGYCFELNGLFTWALREAGFSPVIHLARVKMHAPEPGPLTHQLSLVEAGGRTWLADVGFGGPGIRYPMPFELGRIEEQDGESFRLRLDPDFGNVLELRQESGDWLQTYFFQASKVLPIDINMGNHFTSTWEQSIFRKGPMLARPFPGGKHTMYGNELKRWQGAVASAEKITEASQFTAALRERFGIRLDPAKENRLAAMVGEKR